MVRPWKPRIVEMTLVRWVIKRANLSAASTASVPELHKKARSKPGGATRTSSASRCARTLL